MENKVYVDVFISYSSKNKNVADAVVSDFEKNGIRCWYAPRDIMPGKEWVSAIKEGIYSAKVFVLIFTEESNSSRQVMNEVAMAFNAEKTIVPFKLTEKGLSDELEYYLTRVHWLDAVSKPLNNHIDELRRFVEIILSGSNPNATLNRELLDKNEEEYNTDKSKKVNPLIYCSVAVVLVIAVIILIIIKPFSGNVKNVDSDLGKDTITDNNANDTEIIKVDTIDSAKNNVSPTGSEENSVSIEDSDKENVTPLVSDNASGSELSNGITEREEWKSVNELGMDCYAKGDYKNALSYFMESIDKGNTSTKTYYCLAKIYLDGLADESADEEQALNYFELAYNDGNGEVLTPGEYHLLAYKYDSDSAVQNSEKVYKFALEGAKNGSVECMIMLGDAYWYGKGVEQDYDQVLNWFGKALDSGIEGYKHNYCIYGIETLVEEGNVTKEAASKWIDEK